ncbi:MAG: amidohydrolase family protein, partial [Actinomycetota bacterium]
MPASPCCCTPNAAAVAHLGPGFASAPTTVTPARHRTAPVRPDRADLLVLGRIATGEPGAPTAEAMAVSGGSIIAIGDRGDVEQLADAATRVVVPDGVVIPGLIEPHMHVWAPLLTLDWTDVSHAECATFDDVVETVKRLAARTAPGEFVLAKRFDPSLYPGEPPLTREILDRVAPDNPAIVMNASLHFVYVNSATFAAAGISDDIADPPGGTYGRRDGRLDGIVGEPPAMLPVLAVVPKPDEQGIIAGIDRVLTTAAARGVTSVREAATGTLAGIGEVTLLHRANGIRRLPTRISTAQFGVVPRRTPGE